MKAFEKTDYGDIFENSYWGRFVFEENTMITNKIIDNRNNFVNEYNINSYEKNPPQYLLFGYGKGENYIPKNINTNRKEYLEDCVKINSFIDHPEVYKNKDNFILIFSPYGKLNKEKIDLVTKNGWKRYKKLYAQEAETWIKLNPIGERNQYCN